MSLMPDFVVPNTLALRSTSIRGAACQTIGDVRDAIADARRAQLPLRVIGEGSNVVASDRIETAIAVNQIPGVDVLERTDEQVRLRVGAGVNWHYLVMHSLAEGWHGLENLALIPGSLGAAPVQNIGAYGAELSGFVARVDVVTRELEHRVLSRAECGFGYRTSVFQNRLDWVITGVELVLSRVPRVNLTYPEVANALTGVEAPQPQDVAQVVIAIRRKKLPDPETDPNVGSFFRNPVVSETLAVEIGQQIEGLVRYEVEAGVKLSAAQLIDRAGWKSKPGARVSCWQTQPLILVNRGGASAEDVLEFAERIRVDILQRYRVQLELEPSVLS
ncbi:MAG: UDP-N-acetylmuramate dehydrogenase [Pseudomonadota bacterium]